MPPPPLRTSGGPSIKAVLVKLTDEDGDAPFAPRGGSSGVVVSKIEPSHSAPVVNLSAFGASNIHTNAEGTQILGTVNLAGTITSRFCDFVPDPVGRIKLAYVYLSDSQTPVIMIDATVSKSFQESFSAPYPFSATFDQSYDNIPLSQGSNLFRVAVVNPTGITGTSEFSVTVAALPPDPPDKLGITLWLQLISDRDSPVILAHLGTLYSFDDEKRYPPAGEATLQQIAPNTYQAPDGDFTIVLQESPLQAVVTNKGADFHEVRFPLEAWPAAPQTAEITVPAGPTDYRNYTRWTFPAPSAEALGATGKGILNAYALRLEGNPKLLEDIASVTVAGVGRMAVKAFDGFYYLASDSTFPEIYFFMPGGKSRAFTPETEDFGLGFVKGLLAGGVDFVSGLVQLAKCRITEGLRFSPIALEYGTSHGEHYSSELTFGTEVTGLAAALARICYKLEADEFGTVVAWLSRSDADVNALSRQYSIYFQYTARILATLYKSYRQEPAEKQGYVLGRVSADVLPLLVVPEKPTDPDMLEFLHKLKELDIFQAAKTPRKDRCEADKNRLSLLAVFHFIGAGLAGLGICYLIFHYWLVHTMLTNPQSLGVDPARFPPPQIPPARILAITQLICIVFGTWFIVSLIGNVLSGVWLRARKARMFSIAVGALNCLWLPLGTVLGVWTILVLIRPSVRKLYGS